jgi:hypothetical protein
MPGCEQGCLRGRWSIAAGGSQSSNTIAHFALAFSRKESVCVGKAGEDLMNALRIVACLAGLRSGFADLEMHRLALTRDRPAATTGDEVIGN